MSRGSKMSVRLAAERVFVRSFAGDRITTFELTLDEARQLRDHLNGAIAAIQSGASVLPSFAGFLAVLPVKKPA